MTDKRPGDDEKANEARRRLEYDKRLTAAGGRAEVIAWVLTLSGLLITVGRHWLNESVWVLGAGLVLLIVALGFWIVVFLNRRRYRRDHPFNG